VKDRWKLTARHSLICELAGSVPDFFFQNKVSQFGADLTRFLLLWLVRMAAEAVVCCECKMKVCVISELGLFSVPGEKEPFLVQREKGSPVSCDLNLYRNVFQERGVLFCRNCKDEGEETPLGRAIGHLGTLNPKKLRYCASKESKLDPLDLSCLQMLKSGRDHGFVINISHEKGFGFIKSSTSSQSFFFHVKNCETDFKGLSVGSNMSFDERPSTKKHGKFDAIKIRLVGASKWDHVLQSDDHEQAASQIMKESLLQTVNSNVEWAELSRAFKSIFFATTASSLSGLQKNVLRKAFVSSESAIIKVIRQQFLPKCTNRDDFLSILRPFFSVSTMFECILIRV